MQIKRIAILTSGGDAPGMNSAILGAFTACDTNKIELFGVKSGYDGLIDNEFIKLNQSFLFGRTTRGGSILKSARSARFLKKNYFLKAVQNLKENKIDGLIVIGGDGSLHGAMRLRDAGINTAFIPATIDNDLNFTFTLGFDTATNSIVNAIDNIYDSISSFNYGAVIKIMGRECTDLINSVAAAINTNLVITSANYAHKDLIKQIKALKLKGTSPVILVLENVVDVTFLATAVQNECKIQMRPHILGYIQRGGAPSAFDRRYGISAAKMAINCLKDKENVAIGFVDNNLTKKPFEQCFKK